MQFQGPEPRLFCMVTSYANPALLSSQDPCPKSKEWPTLAIPALLGKNESKREKPALTLYSVLKQNQGGTGTTESLSYKDYRDQYWCYLLGQGSVPTKIC